VPRRSAPTPWVRRCAAKPEPSPPAEAPKAEAKPEQPSSSSSKPSAPKAEPQKAEAEAKPEQKAEPKAKAEAEAEAEATKAEGSGDKGAPKNKPEGQSFLDGVNPSMAAFAAAGAAYFLYSVYDPGEEQLEITVQELVRDYLVSGQVAALQIVNRRFCRVRLNRDSAGRETEEGRLLTIQLGNPEAFEARIEQAQLSFSVPLTEHVPISHVYEFDFVTQILPYSFSILILASMMLGLRGMSNGNPMGGMGGPMGGGGGGGRSIFNMGKAFPDGQKGAKSKIKFKDVAGQEQAKREVMEFVDFLRDPTKYEKLGAKIPKGGLLVGPPGTGKTLLAKAVAGEAECPFYSMSGSEFVEMFVGVGPSRMRDLFKEARENAPSIIFIDEIDAVGRKRGGSGGGGNDERESTLNQMLVEMDGFNTSTGVVVLAGTNRADVLDDALKRPGRFDRQIQVDRPDLNERAAIFMVHLGPVTLAKHLPKEDVAKRMAALTPGFVGADIANICNEAAIVCARRNGPSVEMEDFERATERVIGGLPKSNNLMGAEARRTVALHESGHAVAGWYLEHSDPLLKVSVVPRSSGALGFAQYLPQEMALHSKEAILDKMCVALGGRAAEEIFVGKISTGASDDLSKVTQMAYSMVRVYGMNSELGLLSYSQDSQGQFYKPYSEETGRMIDQQARALVETQYERVKELLTSKSSVMTELADALQAKETLVYGDLRDIMGERPYQVKGQQLEYVTAGTKNPFTDAAGPEPAAPAEAAADGPIPALQAKGEAMPK